MRYYSWFDKIVARLESALEIIGPNYPHASRRPTPKPDLSLSPVENKPFHQHPISLSENDNQLSIRYMRVNHSGEVAAQALYFGQALFARNALLRVTLKEAALEEKDHLRWCKERILNLQGRTSYLNPIWAAGSFGIGALAGLISDKISLSFLAETEHQVTQHLDNHLKLIPASDVESLAILSQMRLDEAKHANTAIKEGGVPLPPMVQGLMRFTARIMTTVAFYF